MSIMNFNKFSSINENENMDEILSKWTEDKVLELLDECILDYVDSDWEDEYDSEYEAYVETGRGEAENDVIMQILKSVGLGYDEELYYKIADHFNLNTN
jgi:hypothetical protein